MKTVFFDIETIPDPLDPLFGERLLLPEAELSEEEIMVRGGSLHPLRGRLACITAAVDGGEPFTVSAWGVQRLSPTPGDWDVTEASMLMDLRAGLVARGVGARSTLVGHNVCGFDIPWLYLRCVKYQLPFRRFWPWPVMGGKPWEGGVQDRVHDTCLHLRGPMNRGAYLRLTETVAWMGLDLAADEGSGSDCLRWWLEGRQDLIQQHCEADVRNQRSLYALLTGWEAPNE